MKKQKQRKEIDPAQTFAEKVRDHKDLESRWAVFQEARVEYFRGKDFASFLQKHQDLKAILGPHQASSETTDDIGSLLLKKKLIIRCDRVVKTVRPGKTKLSKWPARLELHPDQTFSVNDAFFAWTFERRRPLWQTVLSFLVPIVTLACCLFPVFPHWCKLVVLYTCLTFLAAVFTLLLLRLAVFGIAWILLGKRAWFFPNILAEEASFKELFRFWPEPAKEDEKPPSWTARLGFAVVVGLIGWFCIHYGPDEAARTRYHRRVSNIIDEVLEWSPKLALSGNQTKTPTDLNQTQSNQTTMAEASVENQKSNVSNDYNKAGAAQQYDDTTEDDSSLGKADKYDSETSGTTES
ncbi:hypothetical protein KP509_12G080600 [Ceratopteris richardii]|uniref:Translocation protein SEC62 n=1 Tax=Ceratopteris richardii TaxID=49495 RepID=A0A8T2TN66_CERRI|nr:hypothetical protein KP509_12G080600 [Ceratopteris richardii]